MNSATAILPRLWIITGMIVVAGLSAAVAWGPAGLFLEREVGLWQNAIAAQLGGSVALKGWRLFPVAFIGGLVASLSPCILGMLPVNLSYIGASKVRSRGVAVRIALMFVLGVIAVNIVLGLVSSLFFALFIQYRAPVNIAVGALTILMGLWLVGLIRLPTPQIAGRVPPGGGSFVVGLVFALVATPCASPILVFILGAASLAGSPARAIGAMTVYAIGYSFVLFLASLFAGIAVASRRVLTHAGIISRIAAVALIIIGISTVAYGLSQL